MPHHEAVSLLQRLLCVNPARRISAKQALAHPYFTTIRAQLGEPPVFRPEEIFEFEFDDQEFSLTHLKALIQSEVKLLQNNGLSPSTPVHEPIEDAEQQPEDFDDTEKQSENYDNDNDDSDDDVHVQEADSLATKRGVRHGHCEEAKQTNTTRDRRDTYGPTGPEDDSEVLVVDECEQASSNSESGITKHPRQHQQQEDEEIEAISRKKQLATAKVDTQDNDDDKIVNVAKRSENSTVSSQPVTPIAHALASAVASRQTSSTTTVTTTISCSLARPKNAETTTCRNLTTSSGSAKSRSTSDGISYSSQQDSHDGEKVSSIASTSSNNQHYQNSSNSLDFIEFRGKWSHPQSRAMAPTASSRLHRSTAHIASVSLIHKRSERRSEPVKIAPTTTRFGVLWTSSSNNNQLRSPGTESIDRDSVKSDAPRGPERLSSTITAATASSRRRRSSTTNTVRQISSARKKSLEGRICQTHPESGRQHFYKSLNKVAWKMPAKPQHLDNISPSTSDSSAPSSYVAYDHSRSHVVPGTSSISPSPTNALPLEYPRSGAVLLSRQSGSGTISNLPKEWKQACRRKGTIHRKKATVPRNPKFTQMSWQRKKSHATKG
ncbi:unnamed protein product [Peronospora destructor]|uniref:Protein kinase domain-containing protein n=1 Tax=Peronospora destructor TaxID=86335 RepID=A0AAV0TTB7_9STRA|nr:unnamed protein product [Peronospora destructor]